MRRVARDDELGLPPCLHRRAEEQRPPLDLARLVENRKDLGVEVSIEIEHLRLVNRSVPICLCQLRLSRRAWIDCGTVTFSARRLQLRTVEHGDKVVHLIAATRAISVAPMPDTTRRRARCYRTSGRGKKQGESRLCHS